MSPAELAERLLAAQANGTAIDRIDPDARLSEDEAYQVQFALVEAKLRQGDSVIGLKTGLTSVAKQQAMGVAQPVLGHLLASSLVQEGEPVSVAGLIHPRAEPELAFVLGRDIEAPVNAVGAREAVESVLPGIEIIDSRFRDFRFGLTDVIADNTSAARVAFGNIRLRPDEIDARLVGMVFSKNGAVESTAAGAALMGDPYEALAWLAGRACQLGRPLRAGQFVLAGALADAVPIAAGDSVTLEFDRLGTLSLRFE